MTDKIKRLAARYGGDFAELEKLLEQALSLPQGLRIAALRRVERIRRAVIREYFAAMRREYDGIYTESAARSGVDGRIAVLMLFLNSARKSAIDYLSKLEKRVESRSAAELTQAALRMARGGALFTFIDGAGRRYALSDYMAMAVRTILAQAMNEAVQDAAALAGDDLVRVTNTPTVCKKCKPWIGKILRVGDREARRELFSGIR